MDKWNVSTDEDDDDDVTDYVIAEEGMDRIALALGTTLSPILFQMIPALLSSPVSANFTFFYFLFQWCVKNTIELKMPFRMSDSPHFVYLPSYNFFFSFRICLFFIFYFFIGMETTLCWSYDTQYRGRGLCQIIDPIFTTSVRVGYSSLQRPTP